MSTFVLDPVFYDIDWDRLPQVEDHGGLHFSHTQKIYDWIVQLEFEQQGNTSYGTGFYINIPGTKMHVILTAAHNLISKGGQLSKNLRVRGKNSSEFAPKDSNIFISQAYRRDPKAGKAENDYGAILVQSSQSGQARGFGFALNLRDDRLCNSKMQVVGYLVDSTLEDPTESSGPCVVCQPNELRYDVSTEKGLSGSPVFIPYKGHETVVAIHNNAPRPRQKGSRGARLSEPTLREIFGWAQVGYTDKALRVLQLKPAFGQDMYLRLAPEEEYACVRLGRDGLDTSFDIFPAYAPASAVENHPLHVFRFRPPEDWPRMNNKQLWVLWDIMQKAVSLTTTLQDYCFVRIVNASDRKVQKKNGGEEGVHIVLVNPMGDMGELVELRMGDSMIKAEDIEMGDVETHEVSFEKHRRGKKAKYNIFCFE
ncbi:hypothetical protein ASPZODRAFT_16354 [Penicilliopsis zonata CBS 506.65]|uniref:Serine protease n=1 Tax=Penicilliopsis zonata CBS 506.65 TaxID=1073090 RepID=A0A1L9SH67_9EURO|nr:hypothetical protein ASPZODRAFT_16354 [Penicilliopsis zonata CBS 506.65]OJJ46600.1 hypothetical protein ASPZODRAFT_16354 [Penicilliopsis zonata CBS 506.65]